MAEQSQQNDVHVFPYFAVVAVALQTVDMVLCSIRAHTTLTMLSGLLLMLISLTAVLAAERRYRSYHYAMYTCALLSSAVFGVVLCHHICVLDELRPAFAVTRLVILSLVFASFLLWFTLDCAHEIVLAKSRPTITNPQDADEDPEDESKDADVVAI